MALIRGGAHIGEVVRGDKRRPAGSGEDPYVDPARSVAGRGHLQLSGDSTRTEVPSTVPSRTVAYERGEARVLPTARPAEARIGDPFNPRTSCRQGIADFTSLVARIVDRHHPLRGVPNHLRS
jgi:hypothetical protein